MTKDRDTRLDHTRDTIEAQRAEVEDRLQDLEMLMEPLYHEAPQSPTDTYRAIITAAQNVASAAKALAETAKREGDAYIEWAGSI